MGCHLASMSLKTSIDETATEQTPGYWNLVIMPRGRWFDLHLGDLWQYRDLIMLLVRRDLVAQYKQTVLGPTWFVLQPLLSTIVLTLVFSRIAGMSTDGQAPFLFYLVGSTAWGFFSGCFSSTSNTFIANAGVFGKVYFPRLCVPIAVIISNLARFGIQFLMMVSLMAVFAFRGTAIRPTLWILALPLLVLHMGLLGLGLGILASSLTTRYRDLVHLLSFGVQLWMYASPVVYPLSAVPPRYHPILALNPITPVIEAFRLGFLGAGVVRTEHVVASIGITISVLAVGIVLFNRIEKTFMDTV